jgi:hypothetical protein
VFLRGDDIESGDPALVAETSKDAIFQVEKLKRGREGIDTALIEDEDAVVADDGVDAVGDTDELWEVKEISDGYGQEGEEDAPSCP